MERRDFDKIIHTLEREGNKPVQKKKIGRNDPCPCGSGKKYKHCCLNKPKEAIDLIEKPEERRRWLKRYPYTGTERIEDRIYLADYFDETSIETDKILYLAFQMFAERMEKEQISDFAEYDEKYSIHYQCEEWIGELCRLLKENNDMKRYEEVRQFVSGNGISI